MAEKEQKDPYLEVMREVVSTKQERGTLYKQEPKDVVPVEVLEGMMMYKATRAFYSTDAKKKRDELIDLINYSAFIVMRLDLEAVALPRIKEIIDRTNKPEDKK